MSRAALSLPDGFDIRQFLRTICVFTLILEILGRLRCIRRLRGGSAERRMAGSVSQRERVLHGRVRAFQQQPRFVTARTSG